VFAAKKTSQVANTPERAQDSVEAQAPTVDILKRIADAVVEQLTENTVDKKALMQLDKVLAAVANAPQDFDRDTQAAIKELKDSVADVVSSSVVDAKTIDDISRLIQKMVDGLSARLSSAGGVADVVLKPQSNASEGYASFDSVKDAVAWLSANKEVQENLPWQKLSQTYGNGPVVLKIYESAIGDMRASFIVPDNMENEMGHLSALLKASIWKSVSPAALMQVLRQNNGLPLENLLVLDEYMVKSEAARSENNGNAFAENLANASKNSPQGFDCAFGQWLNTALESGLGADTLAKVVPSFGQDLPKMLSSVMATIGHYMPQLDQVAQTEGLATVPMQFSSPQSAISFVNDLFKGMGLDNEARLLTESNQSSQTVTANLKTALMTLSKALEISDNSGENDGQVALNGHAQQAGPQDFQRQSVGPGKVPALGVLRPAQMLSLSVALSHVQTSDMLSGIYYCAKSIETQMKAMSPDNGTPEQFMQSLTANDGLSQTLVTAKMLCNDCAAMAKENADSLLASVRALSDDVSKESVAAMATQNGRDPQAKAALEVVSSVKTASEMLGRLSDTVSQLTTDLSQFSRAMSSDALPKDLRQAALETIQNAMTRLDECVKNITAFSQKADHAVSQKTDVFISTMSKQADAQDGGAFGPSPKQAMDEGLAALKHQVDQAIGRIESMQVLARQVALSEGQQQVISLPMRIDGEWTGVVVRFLKKSPPKTSTKSKPVAVSLHVAPRMLGNVDVFMDFDGVARYGMRMEFEKTSTKKWFEQNKDTLTKALVGVGFGVFGIDMKDVAGLRKPFAGADSAAPGRYAVDLSA